MKCFCLGSLAFLLGLSGIAGAQVADAPSEVKAGIPVNYTEAQVGSYALPDPLKFAGNKAVTNAKAWLEKRRPEIVKLFEENQYGRTPSRPADMSFDIFDKGTPAFDGKAIRRQVTIYFSKDKSGPRADLLLYLPAGASKPVPVLLNAGFTANNLMVSDPGVKVGRIFDPATKSYAPAKPGGFNFGGMDVLPVIEHGFGLAMVNYAEIDPDSLAGLPYGVRQSISAEDYFDRTRCLISTTRWANTQGI